MGALVNCRACGNAVSDEAMTCPRCGHPLRDPDWKRYAKAAIWIVAIFAALTIAQQLWGALVSPRLGTG